MINRIRAFYYDNRDFFTIVLVTIVAVIVYMITGIGCPIKLMTGISCAGCGMTRAWMCLMHFNFSEAFHYHPLFMLPPVVLVIIFFKKKMNSKVYYSLLLFAAFLLLTVYLFRILNPEDMIVTFEPDKGLLLKHFYN